jgi:Domain of unknown function (DUF4124)
MRRSSSLSSLLVLCLLAAASSAHAQWMWRDKTGRVHMSDRAPPSDVGEKDVLKRPAGQRAALAAAPVADAASAAASASTSASAPAVPAAARVDPELEARRKKAELEQAAQKKQAEERVAAARAENCQRAQSHMRNIDSGIRMARTNAKGEPEVLDDRMRAEEAERTRSVIAANCVQ